MSSVRCAGPILIEAIEALEDGVAMLVTSAGKPLYAGKRGYRYAKKDSRLMQILKAVRVASGLRAVLHLLDVGHAQEAGVLLRSVNDALNDIWVLDEAHYSADGPKAYQQRMVDQFFGSDDFDRFVARVAGDKVGISRVGRKQKFAAIERQMRPYAGDGDPRTWSEAIVLALDGYEHAGYTHIMEMYDPDVEAFRMRGELSHWVPVFVRHCALLASPALNWVASMLRDLEGEHARSKADEIKELRMRLEASPEYRETDGE